MLLALALALAVAPSLAEAQESSDEALKRARDAQYRRLQRQTKPTRRRRSRRVEDWVPREEIVRSLELHPRTTRPMREAESTQIVHRDRPVVHAHAKNPLRATVTVTPTSESTP